MGIFRGCWVRGYGLQDLVSHFSLLMFLGFRSCHLERAFYLEVLGKILLDMGVGVQE